MIKSIARHGTILVVVVVVVGVGAAAAAASTATATATATHAFEQQHLYDEGYRMIIIDKREIDSLICRWWNGAIVTATTTTTNAFKEHHTCTAYHEGGLPYNNQ